MRVADGEPSGSLSPYALAALHRAMLWREAQASVALDHDERVRTISLDDLRRTRADELVAEGNALRDRGDIEGAADLWAEAHDVRRGHSDEPEWLGEAP